MNIVLKFVMYFIFLNVATGLLTTVIVDEDGNNVFSDVQKTSGITYTDGVENRFIGEMNASVNPSGLLENKGDANYRILDMMNLGFFVKFLNMLDYYFFGFVNLLRNLLGPFMSSAASAYIFGALKSFIGIAYIFVGFDLLTGRKLLDD